MLSQQDPISAPPSTPRMLHPVLPYMLHSVLRVCSTQCSMYASSSAPHRCFNQNFIHASHKALYALRTELHSAFFFAGSHVTVFFLTNRKRDSKTTLYYML